MIFSDRLIELAVRLHSSRHEWKPAPGHYVLDPHRIVERASPFQERIYFVLNYPHFVRLAGGEDQFREKLVWLPTFEQARELLRSIGVSNVQQQQLLIETDSIAENRELETLYEAIVEHFQ